MKRSKWIYAVAAALLLGIVAFVAFGRKGPDAAQQTRYKITKVERGDVRKTVSATGTLEPYRTVDIKSKAGGRVVQMLVDVGTIVKKDQIIANIDPSDTLLTVNQAEADITSAEARKEQNTRTYRLQVRQSEIAIKNARAALQAARDSRSAAASRLETAKRQAKTQPELTGSSISQATASYNQAVKQRSLLDATNKQQRASVKAAYDQAVANAKNASSELERQKNLLQKGFVSTQAVENAQTSYEVAQAQVSTAKARLDTLDAELSANVQAADARVAQARASLRSAEAGKADISNRQDEVRQAEASLRQANSQVAQAEQNLNQAIENRANNEIRRLDIATAVATETRSRATLKNARETLEQTTVRAPSDGVVLTKYVDEGTIITSGLSLTSQGSSIVQLGDISRMFVDVLVDESDIANVDEGQKVDISMDAYPGVPFEGKVDRVDPQAVVEQNVTMIHVRVEVDNSSPTFRLLKPGMNATCEFVVDEREDVLVVPNTAVQTNDDGSFVQVVTGGKPAPPDAALGTPMDENTLIGVTLNRRPVEVGVEGDETDEVISGLKEGEAVVVQTIEPATAASAGGSPFGGRGPGGRR